jgi:hypothetical protein
VALGVWGGWYALHRLYHALGGDVGMVGRPAPEAHFRRDNLGWRRDHRPRGSCRSLARIESRRIAEQWRRIAELERALGRKTYGLEIAGRLLRRRSARRALRLPS